MIFDFVDWADKGLGWPWRFLITGAYQLVSMLCTYSSCMLYHQLTAVYLDTTTVTSDSMLHLILAASGLTDNFKVCVWGHIFGGCNCSVALNWVVSALLLGLIGWRIAWSTCRSVRFCSTVTLLWCLWSYDLLLWMWRDDDNETKWEVLRKKIMKRSEKSRGTYS